jgi:hypothetical protein
MENLTVFRKFPSPSLENSTTSTSSGGSPINYNKSPCLPILERKSIGVMVTFLAKSMEDPTEVFLLHFCALQLLHELVNSNEFQGQERLALELQIREIMDAMNRQLAKLDSPGSVQNITGVVLKQVAGIVCKSTVAKLTNRDIVLVMKRGWATTKKQGSFTNMGPGSSTLLVYG